LVFALRRSRKRRSGAAIRALSRRKRRRSEPPHRTTAIGTHERKFPRDQISSADLATHAAFLKTRQVAPVGVEHSAKPTGKPADSKTGGAKSGALSGDEPSPTPPEAAPEADLIRALAMLDRLPLSDTERAEAVRRLLAQAQGGPTP